MSHDAALQRLAAWIQREDEELLYEPDCGPWFGDVVRPSYSPDGVLLWPADDPLGLPMLDASEE